MLTNIDTLYSNILSCHNKNMNIFIDASLYSSYISNVDTLYNSTLCIINKETLLTICTLILWLHNQKINHEGIALVKSMPLQKQIPIK